MTDKEPKDSIRDRENFDDPVSFERLVLLKVDKLTRAVYLVTNGLVDNDSLKWRLRDKSLELFWAVRDWAKALSPEARVWPNGLAFIDDLVFLLSLGRAEGRVSAINLEILQTEYANLKKYFLGYEAPKRFYDLALPEASEVKENQPKITISKPQEKKPVKPDDNRREAVLQFLLGKNGLSIKEISRALPRVSTKTVQRELAALVAEGRVRREGDRRWSRYSLS